MSFELDMFLQHHVQNHRAAAKDVDFSTRAARACGATGCSVAPPHHVPATAEWQRFLDLNA